MELKGKTALISGAGRNNGRAIALTFARAGADVILIARERSASLNDVARECENMGVAALPVLANVGDPAEVERAVKLGLERFGKVDVLACVAGIRHRRPRCEYTYEEWHDAFAINVHSTFYLARALAPQMMERRSGSIIALGAVASLTTIPNFALETACKHALFGLIKSLALELGPYGVRANLIALATIENQRAHPEWYLHTNTKGEVVDLGTDGKSARPDFPVTPIARKGTNQEVANIALFLASERSSYVTGDRILCAGGRYL